jgi:hypothetical protein
MAVELESGCRRRRRRALACLLPWRVGAVSRLFLPTSLPAPLWAPTTRFRITASSILTAAHCGVCVCARARARVCVHACTCPRAVCTYARVLLARCLACTQGLAAHAVLAHPRPRPHPPARVRSAWRGWESLLHQHQLCARPRCDLGDLFAAQQPHGPSQATHQPTRSPLPAPRSRHPLLWGFAAPADGASSPRGVWDFAYATTYNSWITDGCNADACTKDKFKFDLVSVSPGNGRPRTRAGSPGRAYRPTWRRLTLLPVHGTRRAATPSQPPLPSSVQAVVTLQDEPGIGWLGLSGADNYSTISVTSAGCAAGATRSACPPVAW